MSCGERHWVPASAGTTGVCVTHARIPVIPDHADHRPPRRGCPPSSRGASRAATGSTLAGCLPPRRPRGRARDPAARAGTARRRDRRLEMLGPDRGARHCLRGDLRADDCARFALPGHRSQRGRPHRAGNRLCPRGRPTAARRALWRSGSARCDRPDPPGSRVARQPLRRSGGGDLPRATRRPGFEPGLVRRSNPLRCFQPSLGGIPDCDRRSDRCAAPLRGPPSRWTSAATARLAGEFSR